MNGRAEYVFTSYITEPTLVEDLTGENLRLDADAPLVG
jgi:hypothetical protein